MLIHPRARDRNRTRRDDGRQDLALEIWPSGQHMLFEDSGANGFELPGATPSGDTVVDDAAYDVTIAETQTFNNGQYGRSIATRGPGTEGKAAIESEIAGRGPALAEPLTKFVVLAFESSGWTDNTVVCRNNWSTNCGSRGRSPASPSNERSY